MALQRNIFKRKTFWNFFSLTIQAIFFLLQRSSESVVLKHEVILLPLCRPQPCPAPLLVLVQRTGEELGSLITLLG